MAEDDVVFQEAVEALREGKKAHARELLTGLLKTDQNNATYWVWMSATVDSPKERIYCLQTALKLDPENATAKRGLILHGALPPDDTIQPFPVNRPRAWEAKLLLAHEKPKLKGWAAIKASPVVRIGGFVALAAVIVSGVVFGLVLPRMNQVVRTTTITPGPSPTFTLTPTAMNATGQPAAAVGTPAPLSDLLSAPFTPTPLYVVTPGSPMTFDYYRQARNAYAKGDWDEVIRAMGEVVKNDPQAADAYYYIGEAYRFKGDFSRAVASQQSALGVNPNFGAAYVGLARAQLGVDPNTDVTSILDDAIRLDPNFGDAYIERAGARVRKGDVSGALQDLTEADARLPNSPLVYYTLSLARLQEGDLNQALAAAQRANQLDVTHLETYLLMGQIHAAMDNEKEALENLDIYLKYRANDAAAYMLLGEMQFNDKRYEDTIETMSKALRLDRNRRDAYYYRFFSNLELGRGEQAEEDVDRVILFYPDTFEVRVGVVRMQLLLEHNGTALLELEKVNALAKTDEQKAHFYYWTAIVHEKRDDMNKAEKAWEQLLDLPRDAMSTAMRAEAEQHLRAINPPTPTKTPTPTKPVKVTATKNVTSTPTPTRTPTATP